MCVCVCAIACACLCGRGSGRGIGVGVGVGMCGKSDKPQMSHKTDHQFNFIQTCRLPMQKMRDFFVMGGGGGEGVTNEQKYDYIICERSHML